VSDPSLVAPVYFFSFDCLYYLMQIEHAESTCTPVSVDSEHPLFLLYTSGSTGKPKGLMHTTAGYLLHTMVAQKACFDVREGDVFGCAADIGWLVG
jgi:acetyl-CoA synthetase